MFTGIITDIGRIEAIEMKGDLRARIGTAYDMTRVDLGASIACDGVCLTVVAKGQGAEAGWFDVDISAETVSKTNLDTWAMGRAVNLERALRVGAPGAGEDVAQLRQLRRRGAGAGRGGAS